MNDRSKFLRFWFEVVGPGYALHVARTQGDLRKPYWLRTVAGLGFDPQDISPEEGFEEVIRAQPGHWSASGFARGECFSHARFVVLDFDHHPPPTEWGHPGPHLVLRTGGGWHCWWALAEVESLESARTVAVALAERHGADPQAARSIGGNARMPGSLQLKHDGFRTRLEHFNPGGRIRLSEFLVPTPCLAPRNAERQEFLPSWLRGHLRVVGETPDVWRLAECPVCGDRAGGPALRKTGLWFAHLKASCPLNGTQSMRAYDLPGVEPKYPVRILGAGLRRGYHLPPLCPWEGPEAALRALSDPLRAHFDRLLADQEPRLVVVNARTGSGKDHHTRHALLDWCRANPGQPHAPAALLVSRLDEAERKAAEFAADDPAQPVKVLASPVSLGCERQEEPEVAEAIAEGWTVQEVFCNSCPLAATCAAKSAERVLHHGDPRRPTVRIFTVQSLLQGSSRTAELSSIIVDEGFPLVRRDQASVHCFERIVALPLREAWIPVVAALRVAVLHQPLGRHRPDWAELGKRFELPDAETEELYPLARPIRDSEGELLRWGRTEGRLAHVLLGALQGVPTPGLVLRLDTEGCFLEHWTSNLDALPPSCLVTDSTAGVHREAWENHARSHGMAVEFVGGDCQNPDVRRCHYPAPAARRGRDGDAGLLGADGAFQPSERNLGILETGIEAARAAADNVSGVVLVATYKAVAEYFEEHPYGPGVQFDYYERLRGKNCYAEVDALVLFGSPNPNTEGTDWAEAELLGVDAAPSTMERQALAAIIQAEGRLRETRQAPGRKRAVVALTPKRPAHWE